MLEYVPARFKVIRTVRPKLSCTRCDRDRAGAGAASSDRSRTGWTGTAGACAGGEVCGSSSAVPAIGDLRTGRHGTGPLDIGRLGRRREPDTGTAGRCAATICVGRGRNCTATTFRFRCWLQETAKRRRADCGPTFGMIGRRAARSAPAVWFAYSPDRKSEHPAEHLRNYRGTLQADGYAGFNRLYETGRDRRSGLLGACPAQVSRSCIEAHASPIAKEALERIAALYGIEKEIRGRPPDERQTDPARASPAIAGIACKPGLKTSLSKLSRKSEVTAGDSLCVGTMDAVASVLRRWPSGDR